jgi:hypothetical protein
LKAGKKLQEIYDSWDDFMESYLLGFGRWMDQHPDDTYTETNGRKLRYEAMKQHDLNPCQSRGVIYLTKNGKSGIHFLLFYYCSAIKEIKSKRCQGNVV